MGWLYIKHKDKAQVHYVTEEAYKAIFKSQGFEIVKNGENSGAVAQSGVGVKNIQPTPEKPHKPQQQSEQSLTKPENVVANVAETHTTSSQRTVKNEQSSGTKKGTNT